jgi:D-amino-acid dehydrogenase
MGETMVACTPIDGHVRLAGTMDLSTVDETMNPRRIDAMKRSAVKYLRGASWNTTKDHWMGMRPLTPDGLPVLGRLGTLTNAYVATGHQMLGLTLAPATATAMTKFISGSEVEQLDAFSPDRFA